MARQRTAQTDQNNSGAAWKRRTGQFRAALAAACIGLGLFLSAPLALSGCGGGGGATTPAAPTSDPTRAGVLTLRFPLLEASRLLPQAGRYLKVEVLDANADGKFVAIPLFDSAGNPIRPKNEEGKVVENATFDLIDRTTNQSLDHTYAYLPLKNLVVRIGSYNLNTISNPDPAENPPLAAAQVSFLPVRLSPDNPMPPAPLKIELETQITGLEITSPDTLSMTEVGTHETIPLSLTAKVGDAIGSLTSSEVQWSYVIVSGTPTTITLDNQTLSATLTASDRLPAVIKVTATDGESKRSVSKQIALIPKPGALDLTLQTPPFGTRSVRVTFTPTQNSAEGAKTLIAPWNDAAEKTNFTKDFSLTPGDNNILVEAFTGDNADGVTLSNTPITAQIVRAGTLGATEKQDSLPIAVPKNPLVTIGVDAISGVQYGRAGLNYTGAYTGKLKNLDGPTALGNVKLVAGQDYILQVRTNAGTALRNDAFVLTLSDGLGTLKATPGTTDRWTLSLISQQADIPNVKVPKPAITLKEAGANRTGQTILSLNIFADAGGQAGFTVN